ncbi:MAG: InlB B-repeat-containing protein, partial [Clostridia bacterium]|nr:InlB B-repeat-containing protein [Clostridia bacterium]
IATNHGIWTWGADASGGASFDGQFVTGWDAPTVWNGGKFTSTTSITADCYGVRIQMKYGDNAEAYWKLTGIRIINGEYPVSTVTYSANGEESSASVTFGGKYTLPTAPAKENAVFKGWYFNADGTGKQITADTVVTAVSDHTVYAVYNEYYKTPNFFEENQLWNITDIENTNIHHVKDASGNYLKLAPVSAGDTTNANYPQSVFFFQYPNLTAGMAVAMDFELVCPDINSAQGIYTYEANVNGDSLSAEKCLMTAWDAPSVWNDGKFTATTEITQDCGGIRVLVRYANSVNAYWKLTGIRVYTAEEYLDIPTYADDKQIDIGGTSWLGTNQTLTYFNDTNGETNFAKLQEAGVTVLAGTFYGDTGSEDDETRLLDLAAKYGIGLFFQKNWDGETIPSYVAHEAFLGYYVDEPAQSNLSSLKTLKEKWDTSAFGTNGKQLYVNLLPIYSGNMGGDYDAYVQEAIETSNLSIVSFDHYMMYYAGEENWLGNINYESNISLRTDWLKNFDIASYYAHKNDKPFWYTLLTTQHLADGDLTKYIDPTVADLTYQMYVAMTYGATNLMHYTFAGTGDYIIDGAMFNQNTGEWTQTYTDVKDASAIIGKWDHVFMSFDWLGASTVTGTEAQTGLITADLTHSVSVDNYGVISSVTSTQDVVVGHFQDDNGYNGVMITNLTIPTNATAASVTVTFGDEYRAVKVYQNGEETLVYLDNGVLSLDVASAEGVFIIPVKAK